MRRGSSLYVIDGDNVIGSWGGPAVLPDARQTVVRRACLVCVRLEARGVVIFDPAVQPVFPVGPVSVRIAPHGQKADDLIRSIIDDPATEVAALTVVTSDKPLYSYARTRGGAVLRTHEWRALERRLGLA